MDKEPSHVEECHIVHMIKIQQQEAEGDETNNKKDPVEQACELHNIPIEKGHI